MKKIEIGFSAGTGISFPLGKFEMFFEGRYTWGLTNLNKGGEINFSVGYINFPVEINENDSMKSRGFQLMLGILKSF